MKKYNQIISRISILVPWVVRLEAMIKIESTETCNDENTAFEENEETSTKFISLLIN